MELCVKQGGPPSKAKYYSTTDSVQVGRLNGEKNPFKGSQKNLKPCTYKLWEHDFDRFGGRACDRVPFA